MRKIPLNAKILSISHNDLDGVGAQILLGGVFKNIEYINASYYNIDKHLLSVNSDSYDYIFVTDISPSMVEVIEPIKNAILIDHHQTALFLNDPKNHRYINTKYSGTYLTNHFLEKMYGEEKMKPFSKLVKLINDYDMWILKYKGSRPLNELYTLYNAEKFRQRFKTGDLRLTKKEKQYLKDIEEQFKKVYDEIEIIEFNTINACFFQIDVFVNEISHKLLHEEGYDIVFFNTLKGYKISMRSKLDNFNLGTYLKENNLGGGHPKAAGISVKNEEDMTRVLDKIENDLYNMLPEIRK